MSKAGLTLFSGVKKVMKHQSRSICLTSQLRDIFNVQDEDDFKEKVLESPLPVVVDFHAKWCRPCTVLGPRLESIIGSKKDDVHLAKVDIDVLQDTAMDYRVSSVPTVLAMKNGKVTDKFVGLANDDVIASFVDKLIGPK